MRFRHGGYRAISRGIAVALCLMATAPRPAGSGVSQPADSFTLASGPLTETVQGRELLSYLVSCALPAGVHAILPGASATVSFPGDLGLAPGWRERPLTPAEQEIVSACILARVNAFGVPVRLSMRALSGTRGVSGLRTDDDERQTFTLFEGAFFGNIFADPPRKFACTGDAKIEELRALKRICTLAATGGTSVCDFVITGPCPASRGPAGGNRYWPNAIAVFLAPD